MAKISLKKFRQVDRLESEGKQLVWLGDEGSEENG